MPEKCYGVVVVCRRGGFAIPEGPFLAISLRDPADFGLVQVRPALFKRSQSLTPIGAGPWFKAYVSLEIAKMSFGGLAKAHLDRDRGAAVPVADALPVFLQESSQSRLRYAEMRCLKRLPSLFAAIENPCIIPPRFVANQIVLSRTVPSLLLVERFFTL